MANEAAWFEAIGAGDQAQVASLLAREPALLAAQHASGASAVLWAVYTQHSDIAQFLIVQGATVTRYEAAALGLTEVLAQRISEAPESVNDCAPDGFTALGLAAFFGQPAAVDLLLAHGAQPNVASQNSQRVAPLHSAVAHQQVAIARTLIEHGAGVDARQEGGFTPLHEAANIGSLALVRLLLDAGAAVNLADDKGKTALTYALANGNAEVIALLTQHGATDPATAQTS